MAILKDIRDRIKSVKSIQKVTKAMKMVAAAKLRKAQESAEKGRPFSEKMNNIILNLSNLISDKESASKFLVVTGKDKIKTSDFNFHLGSSEKWSIDFDKISKEELKELVENNLAETSIKPKMNEIKLNYKDKDDVPAWLNITESKHIKVR